MSKETPITFGADHGCVDNEDVKELIAKIQAKEKECDYIRKEAITEERDELLQLLRAYERELRLVRRDLMADGLKAAIDIIEDRKESIDVRFASNL